MEISDDTARAIYELSLKCRIFRDALETIEQVDCENQDTFREFVKAVCRVALCDDDEG